MTKDFDYLYCQLQRVNQCLRNACSTAKNIPNCSELIDCGDGTINPKDNHARSLWLKNEQGINCLHGDNKTVFEYGIYSSAVPLTTTHSVMTKYIYSLFWGFQVFNFFIDFIAFSLLCPQNLLSVHNFR